MTHPLISVITVNWNGKHLIGECLDSLIVQSFKNFEIIVVDNGSQDGSLEYIRDRYANVRIVNLSENQGYAGGNNAGIRIALGKYIAFLNNDTKADQDWLKNLIKEATTNQPSIGMWACKIVSYENPVIIDNVGLLLYPDGLARGKGRLEKDNGQYDQQHEALFPSGCAGLYRKEMLEEIGLFDKDFFAYADDVDLGLRARLAGWGCAYVPAAKVYHKYSSATSAYSPLKAFLVERNRIWVLLKYYPLELIVASPYFTLKRLMIQLYGAVTGKGASARFSEQYSILQAVGILFKAWWFALSALPRIVQQRRSLAKVRRISRSELYRLFRLFSISAYEIALKD